MTARAVTPTVFDRLPPRDIEAEEAVLASLMLRPEAVYEVQDILQPSHFFRESNGWVYQACVDLWRSGISIDFVTVSSRLGEDRLEAIGGLTTLVNMIQSVPSPLAAGHYASIVRDCATSRDILSQLHKTAQKVYQGEDPLKLREFAISVLAEVNMRGAATSASIGEVLRGGLADEMVEWMDDPGLFRGVQSGWPQLDLMLDGFQPGAIHTIIGDTAIGKSQFCYNMALSLAKRGHAVSLLSTEMPAKQIGWRLALLEARINRVAVRKRDPQVLTTDERQRLHQAMGRLDTLPIYTSHVSTLPQVEADIYRQKLVHGVSLVFVDHIQHISVPQKEGVTAVDAVMKGLKDAAITRDVPIVAVSHINRETAKSGRVSINGAKWGSSIGQDTDVALAMEPVEEDGTGFRFLSKEEVDYRVAQRGYVDVRVYGEKVRDGAGKAVIFSLSWDAGGLYSEWK